MKDLRKFIPLYVPIIFLDNRFLLSIEWLVIFILVIALAYTFLMLRKKKLLIDQLRSENQQLQDEAENSMKQLEQNIADSKKQMSITEFKEEVTQLLLHDLKNPLSLMVNHELFSKELLGHAATQMLNIINNISDVQHYEKSKIILDLKETQLLNIINNAYKQVEYFIQEKNLQFTNNITDDIIIYADEKILERVFVNLLLNSAKYSQPSGSISIVTEKENNKIKISVIDNGSVIPEDIHDLVFDKFGLVVAKKSNATRSGNLGLGFCKLAIEAHNETIDITSDDNQTCFCFSLKMIGGKYSTLKPTTATKPLELVLSYENKELLKEYIDQLKSKEVFEYSAIQDIISHIEKLNNAEINTWLTHLNKAIKSGDDELYRKMIKLAE